VIAEIVDQLPEAGVGASSADELIFKDTVYTSYAVGNVTLTDGLGVLANAGDSLTDMLERVYLKESNPTITQPSVSLTFPQAAAYEVGTYVTPSYTASFNAGSYQYGGKNEDGDIVKATGVSVTSWSVSDVSGNTSTNSSGSFAQLQVTDGINYYITAVANHSAGYIPVTNLKNEYAAGKISAGSKSKMSGSVTGYRNSFYGTTDNKDALTSDDIRELTKSGKALANGSVVTVNVPTGALRVVFAYPATLRDLTSVKDVNGLNAEIVSGFSKSVVEVEGAEGYTAISYKVYTIEFASANDTANKYTVTI
jgi:hypothetical protein